MRDGHGMCGSSFLCNAASERLRFVASINVKSQSYQCKALLEDLQEVLAPMLY